MSSPLRSKDAPTGFKGRKFLWRLRKQAEELKGQFERRYGDRAIEDNGGVVLYALDNDIVTNITAPWLRSRSQHYLQCLLRKDDYSARESLAYILAEYFLRSNPQLRPLPFLLLPPGDEELHRIWNHVYRSACQERASWDADFREAQRIVRESVQSDSGSPEDPRRDEETVVDTVRRLLEKLHQRGGSIAELCRVVDVQESNNLLPSDRVLLNDEPLLPVPNNDDQQVIAELADSWERDLDRTRPPASRSALPRERGEERIQTNNETDASVLALIEWTNMQYTQQSRQSGAPPKRLCFITGDRTIERVAATRIDDTGQSFTTRFLRNPTCFLCDTEFFELARVETPEFIAKFPNPYAPKATAGQAMAEPSHIQGRSLSDWLLMLFPSQSTPAEPHSSPEILEQIANEARKASEGWAEYLKSAAAQAGLREAGDIFHQHTAELSINRQELHDLLDELQQQARTISENAMTRFGIAGILAGFWSIGRADQWSPSRRPNRTLPSVRLEASPQATALIAEFRGTRTLAEAQRKMERSRIFALRSEDPSGYTGFVALALAFALAGEWLSAFTIASAAFSMVKDLQRAPINPRIKGDEAAYLCAVFRRLSARDIADLDDSGHWLDIAQARQKADPPNPTVSGAHHAHGGEDPRFRSESLAIRIARMQFVQFAESAPAQGSSRDFREQLLGIWTVQGTCNDLLQVIESLKREPSPEVRSAVTEQIATNFLQLQLIAKLQRDERSIMTDGIKRMLHSLKQLNQPRADEQLRDGAAPSMVQFVYLCAVAVFRSDVEGVAWQDRQQCRDFLQRVKIVGERVRARPAMPYDRVRVDKMIELVQQQAFCA